MSFPFRRSSRSTWDGSYRIDGVPPGTYNVVVWHELFGSDSRSIRVDGNGEDVELNFSLQDR